MRKFAQNRQSSKQTNSSNTEATLIPCGSSGERANNTGDTTIKEEDEEKNQKICRQRTDNQTNKLGARTLGATLGVVKMLHTDNKQQIRK